jgi:hypothetical protein
MKTTKESVNTKSNVEGAVTASSKDGSGLLRRDAMGRPRHTGVMIAQPGHSIGFEVVKQEHKGKIVSLLRGDAFCNVMY